MPTLWMRRPFFTSFTKSAPHVRCLSFLFISQVVYPFLDKVTAQKIAFVYSSYYDINGQLLPGKKDDSGFSTYYKQYAKQYDPETYLASLKEQERALLQ